MTNGSPSPGTFPPTERTRIRRDDRAHYDREVVYAVFDEALICHVGFVVDGQPYVMPTIHSRVGDTLYLHGSPATRMMRTVKRGAPVCITATLLDGLVLAKSAFHHSMNYRSAVVIGAGREITDPDEKMVAMRAVVEHVARGRWDEARQPNEKEFKGTAIVAIPIDEASAKVRTGPPIEDDDDLALEVWAGVLPLRTIPGRPEPSPDVTVGTPIPPSVDRWSRSSRRQNPKPGTAVT